MVTKEQVEQRNIQLQKELALIDKNIISRFPLSDYLKAIKSNKRLGKLLQFYRVRKLKRTFEQIASQYGTHALSLYLKLALCRFIRDSLERLGTKISTICGFERLEKGSGACNMLKGLAPQIVRYPELSYYRKIRLDYDNATAFSSIFTSFSG